MLARTRRTLTVATLVAATVAGVPVVATPAHADVSPRDVRWFVSCTLSDRECNPARWDRLVVVIRRDTARDPRVTRPCAIRHRSHRSYWLGYCRMVEDDNTRRSLRMSHAGIAARATIALH